MTELIIYTACALTGLAGFGAWLQLRYVWKKNDRALQAVKDEIASKEKEVAKLWCNSWPEVTFPSAGTLAGKPSNDLSNPAFLHNKALGGAAAAVGAAVNNAVISQAQAMDVMASLSASISDTLAANTPMAFTPADIGKPISGHGLSPGCTVDKITECGTRALVARPDCTLTLITANAEHPYLIGEPSHGGYTKPPSNGYFDPSTFTWHSNETPPKPSVVFLKRNRRKLRLDET